MLEGTDENIAEDWRANKQEKDLEKLKEQLEHKKERHEEHEEVEREMVWAWEMFGKWLINGCIDAMFCLATAVLNELLKEVTQDEGEEWVMEEMVEAVTKEQAPKLSKVILMFSGPSSTPATTKTLAPEQAVPMRASLSASVASSKHGPKQHLELAPNIDDELEPEPESEPHWVHLWPEVQRPIHPSQPPSQSHRAFLYYA